MFQRSRTSHPDLSGKLRDDIRLWNISPSSIALLHTIVAPFTICVDALAELIAVGTTQGQIRIYDNRFREVILQIPEREGKSAGVALLVFARPKNGFKLLCVDSKNTLHIWNLDVYGKPELQTSEPFSSPISRIAVSSSHSHGFIALQEGDIVVYNLVTPKKSSYEIPCAVSDATINPTPIVIIDIVIIPHELNRLLVAYSHIIILYDIISQKIIKTFRREPDSSIDSKDTSIVTTVSLHPSANIFASGYEDGRIYLWDMLSSKPIWAGTIGGSNVQLDSHLEPIFKLEWTLYSELSWLSVLGGHLHSTSHDGISILAFEENHLQDMMGEMRPRRFLYSTPQPVQDFAILSKSNSDSPKTIYMIVGEPPQQSTVHAFQYPPSLQKTTFGDEQDDKAITVEFSAEFEESAEVSRNLKSTLKELKDLSDEAEDNVNFTPLPVEIPFQLCGGSNAVTAVQMVTLGKNAYLQLTSCLSDEPGDSYCLLVSQHRDATVRFHDISTLSGLSLAASPRPLSHLTIRIFDIPEIALQPNIQSIEIEIEQVVFGRHSLECVVRLSSGDIIIFGIGKCSRTQDELGDYLIDIRDNRNSESGGFTPRYIVRRQKSSVTIISLSNIGFLAIGYEDSTLTIIDLRGPRVILEDTCSSIEHKSRDLTLVDQLYWAICGTIDDSKLVPRLLAVRGDGSLIIFTIELKPDGWKIDKSRILRRVHSFLKKAIFLTVVDAKTGEECSATPARLALMLGGNDSETVETTGLDTYLIIASHKEIRCLLGLAGDKVSKVGFTSDVIPGDIKLLRSNQSSVVVAFCQDRVVVYSIPLLEAVHTFKLPDMNHGRNPVSYTKMGDIMYAGLSPEGDLSISVTSLLSHSISSSLGSRLNFRAYKFVKSGEFDSDNSNVQADTQSWGTWMKNLAFGSSLTGEKIDALFSGNEVPTASPKKTDSSVPSSSTNTRSNSQVSTTQSLTDWGQGMYKQLTAAAAERGERLNEIQEQFKHLESGSKDLAAKAKKMAEQQAAKRWFEF